jgi:hypothetical protein
VDSITMFSAGTIAGGGVGDLTELLARGCALVEILSSIRDDANMRILGAFEHGSELVDVHTTGLVPATSPRQGGSAFWRRRRRYLPVMP